MTELNVFQEIQNSEINFKIDCYWNQGFSVTLGDEMNGFGEEVLVGKFEDVPVVLRTMVIEKYPNSGVVRKWTSS